MAVSLPSWPDRYCASNLGFLATVALCAVLLQPFTSRTQERFAPLVVLVSIEECCPPHAWPEAQEVLLDELAAMYVEVEKVNGVGADVTEQRANLGVIAKEKGAVCAIMITREPQTDRGAVDLWTVDKRSGSSVARHLSLRAEEGAQGAAIAAIKAVEALRAGLQELDLHLEGPDETPAIEDVAGHLDPATGHATGRFPEPAFQLDDVVG